MAPIRDFLIGRTTSENTIGYKLDDGAVRSKKLYFHIYIYTTQMFMGLIILLQVSSSIDT